MASSSLNIRTRFARALLPQDCVLCAAASGDELVCAACAADLPSLGESCPRCALPSPAGQVCGRCLTDAPQFDATTATFHYDFPLDRLVQALKYRGRLALAPWFAARIAARVATRPDLLVPMPLHPDRLRERGFNQAVEIARHLARQTGLALAAALARRSRATLPQVELPLAERARNVRGAFSCTADLSGQSIAVVDDVMTSGATLDELARTLKQAGAVRVENWVVARATHHAS